MPSFNSPDQRAVSFELLVWLRFGAVAGQSVVIAVVTRWLYIPLPLAALAVVLALEVLSNLVCLVWLRRGGAPSERFIGALMALDVLLLTALLYLTGGPYNPFNFLYVVHIALAAAVMPPRWISGLVALALSCFAVLFLGHVPLPNVSTDAFGAHLGHEHEHMGLHMKGMWVAFGIAALFIGYFGNRATRALAERDRQLAQVRAEKARSERLAGLATLAAGAAHELSTPLSTIAVVAADLEKSLRLQGAGTDAVEDARLIAGQVNRCRDILGQMAGDAGQNLGEAMDSVELKQLLATVLEGLELRDVELRVNAAPALGDTGVLIPVTALSRALRGLVNNAVDASKPGGLVALNASIEDDSLRLEVIDHGRGMDDEELARAAEPFFTTKELGKGMGLGLFLAHELGRQLGGRLELASRPGKGTRAALVLPILGPATLRRLAARPEVREAARAPTDSA